MCRICAPGLRRIECPPSTRRPHARHLQGADCRRALNCMHWAQWHGGQPTTLFAWFLPLVLCTALLHLRDSFCRCACVFCASPTDFHDGILCVSHADWCAGSGRRPVPHRVPTKKTPPTRKAPTRSDCCRAFYCMHWARWPGGQQTALCSLAFCRADCLLLHVSK